MQNNTASQNNAARDAGQEIIIITCRGAVRGSCGIRHRSLSAAQACCERDAAGIRSVYTSTYPTRAYSDRRPVGLTPAGQAEIASQDDYDFAAEVEGGVFDPAWRDALKEIESKEAC